MGDAAGLVVGTVNVNGIRAAARRGGVTALAERGSDILLLQEVRASPSQLEESLVASGQSAQVHDEAAAKGRAGVAIVSAQSPTEQRVGLVDDPTHSGRWAEGVFDTPIGPVRAVSVYVHSGEVDTPKQDAKYEFLDAMTARLGELLADAVPTIVCGDINIAHTERDIRNAKGNRNKAGFLVEERDYLTRWMDSGWVDLGRAHAGDVDGPYTWWSWRGQAFDRDTGWRIDYGFATPNLAQRLVSVAVDRAPSYAERWSDHAPVWFSFA